MDGFPSIRFLLVAILALAGVLALDPGNLLADSPPNFIWALQANGVKDDSADAVAVDGTGNIYTAGYFNNGSGTGYPLIFGASGTLTSAGYKDGFITKQDSNGAYQWVQQVGGIQNDEVTSICADNAGNLFAAGYFAQATFGTSGTITLTGNGSAAFIAKMSAGSGNFLWVNQIRSNGSKSNRALSVGTDSAGNVYAAGYFIGTVTIPTTTGTTTLVSTYAGGGRSFFVAKLDTTGNFLWVKQAEVAGTGSSYVNGLCVSGTSNVYVAGGFNSSLVFSTTTGTTTLTNDSTQSEDNTFVSNLDAATGNYLWAQQAGGDNTVATAVAMSGSSVIVAGGFQSSVTFGTNGTLTSLGNTDAFVEKLDSNGNFVWATQVGVSLDCGAQALTVDGSGNVYTAGQLNGTATFGTTTLDSATANSVIFITKQDSTGAFLWGQQAIGSDSSSGVANALAVSGSSVIVAGAFGSMPGDTAAFPGATTLANTSDSYGFADIFVAKLSANGTPSTPYSTWQSAHFSTSELSTPSVSGDTADPDHDGIPNLMEYALNLDPCKACISGLPARGTINVSGSNYLKLTFVPNPAATDITYVAQGAPNLSGSSWSTVGSYTSTSGTWVTTGNFTVTSGTATAWDTVPLKPGNRRFMRLRVIK